MPLAAFSLKREDFLFENRLMNFAFPVPKLISFRFLQTALAVSGRANSSYFCPRAAQIPLES